jgi:hypothetical protein
MKFKPVQSYIQNNTSSCQEPLISLRWLFRLQQFTDCFRKVVGVSASRSLVHSFFLTFVLFVVYLMMLSVIQTVYIYLSIYLSIHPSIYGSTALCWALAAFSVS